MSYLISVIIPTKDRYSYLKECIITLMNIDSDQLEIVIQDNTENNVEIIEYLDDLNNANIKYFHYTKSLSQTENSELAVSNASGQYLVYIGDDDSVSELIIDIAYYMNRHHIHAVNVDLPKYNWPDLLKQKPNLPSIILKKSKLKIIKLDTKKILIKYLKNGMQEIRFLPRIYHAVISKETLEKIKEKSGSYFPGPSPDMANAVAAALILDYHYIITVPAIISGSSFNSAAGMGITGKHKGDISKVSQLPNNAAEIWDEKIPKIWLGNTVWPESALKSIKSMGEDKYLRYFNYNAMYARICLKNSEYFQDVKKMVNGPFEYLKLGIEMMKQIVKWIASKLVFKFNFVTKTIYITYKKKSLLEACKIIDDYSKTIKKLN